MTTIAEHIPLSRARSVPLWVRIAALAVAIRAGLWAVGLYATGYGLRPLRTTLLLWSRWDAPHYLDVARYGYAARGHDALWIAFFPVYPLLVRLVSTVVNNLILSGLLVSFGAATLAGYTLCKLVEVDGSRDEGWRATVVLFAFPTAYFFAAPYSESVFVCAVLAAVYAGRTKHWVAAGLFAAVATGSRLVGIAVLPALAVEAMWPVTHIKERLRRLAAISVGGIGTLTYLAINVRAYGDPFHFLEAERGRPWLQHAVWPTQPISEALAELIRPTDVGSWFWFVYPARLGALAIAVGLLLWGRKRLRASDQVFAWTALVLSLLESRLISLPRYLLALYPLAMILAYKLRRAAFVIVIAAFLVMQAYLFSRYALALWAF